jgi:hypothetical protein
MAEMWDLMSDEAKATYADWYTENIRDKGMDAALIDILVFPECLKIPIRCTGCQICQESCIPCNGSSPRVFQDPCKRQHQAEFMYSIYQVVLTCSQILKGHIVMETHGFETPDLLPPRLHKSCAHGTDDPSPCGSRTSG